MEGRETDLGPESGRGAREWTWGGGCDLCSPGVPTVVPVDSRCDLVPGPTCGRVPSRVDIRGPRLCPYTHDPGSRVRVLGDVGSPRRVRGRRTSPWGRGHVVRSGRGEGGGGWGVGVGGGAVDSEHTEPTPPIRRSSTVQLLPERVLCVSRDPSSELITHLWVFVFPWVTESRLSGSTGPLESGRPHRCPPPVHVWSGRCPPSRVEGLEFWAGRGTGCHSAVLRTGREPLQ